MISAASRIAIEKNIQKLFQIPGLLPRIARPRPPNSALRQSISCGLCAVEQVPWQNLAIEYVVEDVGTVVS